MVILPCKELVKASGADRAATMSRRYEDLFEVLRSVNRQLNVVTPDRFDYSSQDYPVVLEQHQRMKLVIREMIADVAAICNVFEDCQ